MGSKKDLGLDTIHKRIQKHKTANTRTIFKMLQEGIRKAIKN